MPKSEKDTAKNYRPVSLMSIDPKTLKKKQQTELNSRLKKLYTTTKWDLFMECQNGLTYTN